MATMMFDEPLDCRIINTVEEPGECHFYEVTFQNSKNTFYIAVDSAEWIEINDDDEEGDDTNTDTEPKPFYPQLIALDNYRKVK